MILNLTAAEARALAQGAVPQAVQRKAANLATPPAPIAGQLDLVEELAKEQAGAAHQRP